MAFRLEDVQLSGYEYRAMRTGEGKNGTWMSLVFETPKEARQIDISVSKELQSDVYNLQLSKGDKVDMLVTAYAGNEYSRVSLQQITGIVDVNGEVQL